MPTYNTEATAVASKFINEYALPYQVRRRYNEDPYFSLIDTLPYDLSLGTAPIVLTQSGELPVAFPSSLMTDISFDGGPNGTSGDLVPTLIKTSERQRTYGLKGAAFKSQLILANDLDLRLGRGSYLVENIRNNMSSVAVQFRADWNREHIIAMSDNKVVAKSFGTPVITEDEGFDFDGVMVPNKGTAAAGAAGSITLATGASASDDAYNAMTVYIVSGTGAGQNRVISDYTGSTRVATVASNWTTNPDNTSVYRVVKTADLPTVDLDWSMLEMIYLEMIRRGGHEGAIGLSGGRHVFPIVMEAETRQRLFKKDIMEELKYANPSVNLERLGVTGSVNGFAGLADILSIRFNAALQKIPPFISVSDTRGSRAAPNPKYAPVGYGTGEAVYGVANVLVKNVFRCRPRRPSQGSVAGASFREQSWMGELRWINNATFQGENDLGDKGYFHQLFAMAAEPRHTYLGYSVLHKLTKLVHG